jgi:hypothetical protein
MPYISPERRKVIDKYVIDNFAFKDAGELNYILTKLCRNYFWFNGRRYQQINDVIGALEGCKLEFYRRLVAPYEDEKIKENGDVYS